MTFSSPTQFEPLLPQNGIDELLSIAVNLAQHTIELRSKLHPTVSARLAKLLREMNSYYSNKIEGQNTHPRFIEQSLNKKFSSKPTIAKLQRLAIAHIETEQEIEANVDSKFNPFSMETILFIHKALYGRLQESDRTTEDKLIIEPGMLRQVEVQVGHHVPPQAKSLDAFLHRFESFYSQPCSLDMQLVKIACAHHRFAWIHPFVDGNGRVARLVSHAALYKNFTGGLWSICRGLARTQDEYYSQLIIADSTRQGDLDGRGNLSEKGLVSFCKYFLNVCLDQVLFVTHMLNLDQMKKRITALIIFLSQENKQIRTEAILPLHYLFTAGELTRKEFKQMTGLSDKIAQTLLSHLLKAGLVESDSPLGPVHFGLPLDALQFYFPNFYPEASTQIQ